MYAEIRAPITKVKKSRGKSAQNIPLPVAKDKIAPMRAANPASFNWAATVTRDRLLISNIARTIGIACAYQIRARCSGGM